MQVDWCLPHVDKHHSKESRQGTTPGGPTGGQQLLACTWLGLLVGPWPGSNYTLSVHLTLASLGGSMCAEL